MPEEYRGRIRAGERVEHYDTIRKRKDGSLVEISLSVSPIRDDTGRVRSAPRKSPATSATPFRRAPPGDAVGQLDHRVKNTLAVIQGLTFRSISPGPERNALLGRLNALSIAHEMLSISSWGSVGLRALVETELALQAEQSSIRGDDLALLPRAGLTFSLVLHELVTNASKHGALGAAGGRVEVAWWVEASDGDEGLPLCLARARRSSRFLGAAGRLRPQPSRAGAPPRARC